MSELQNQIDQLYRRHYGDILAFLLKRIGFQNFEIAEEAVQSAFERALVQWSQSHATEVESASQNANRIPENPAGWLSIVARNAAVDMLRKQQRQERREAEAPSPPPPSLAAITDTETDLNDLNDLAKMLLLCCNPDISTAAQVCLALKAACGFRVREISRVLGMSLEATKKNLSRSRARVAADPDALGELSPARIEARFDAVLETIYAIFTEAHAASAGETQLRSDLAGEALRLADLLLASRWTPTERKPGLHALIALIFFQMARFPARVDDRGVPVQLKDQDRGRWDRAQIRAGFAALSSSQAAGQVTAYHLEARIAAEHARSATFEETDWRRIQQLYEQLLTIKKSPHVRLNRIVALRYAAGPTAALRELDRITESESGFAPRRVSGDDTSRMAWSFLYHAVRADLLEADGQSDAARHAWESARQDAPTGEDRRFIEERLSANEAPAGE